MKIKRILGCLLVVTLMTSLMVGCSTGTSETPRPQPNPAPSTTPSPTPTPNEDEVVDLTPEETLSELTGYVVKIDEGGRVLVVSDKSTSFAETGGDNEFYQAIYFAEMPEGVEVGDKVKVSYGIVLDLILVKQKQKRLKFLNLIFLTEQKNQKRKPLQLL